MEEIIEIVKNEKEINELSPLTWAYVGDSVWELYIRTKLINETKLKPHELHIRTIKFVKAKAQANILKNIYEDLTKEEQEIVRRGRNAKNYHLPKNVDIHEYMHSTAFEALIGYLYLAKKNERLKQIIEKAVKTKVRIEM